MKVAILGCGPAGLMAAAAIWSEDVLPDARLTILSMGEKSSLYGAQYLHAPIPYYTDEEDYVRVKYQMWGTAAEYRRKVYGALWDGSVSPEDLAAEHSAWDIRETYDRLWEDFGPMVGQAKIDYAGLKILSAGQSGFGQFDLIINTIPRPAICIEGHQFRSVQIIAAGDAPKLGIKIPYGKGLNENSVICNGNDHPSWYRLSNIFGHKTVEWADGTPVPLPNVAEVSKPISTNCDCWPDILHVGRYGKWEKGVLTHHAYEEVRKYFEART